MAARTPEEIRASIEANRHDLAGSLVKLRNEVAVVTDWRSQLRKHEQHVLIGAAAAGFVLGGGIAAMTSILGGDRRRRRKRGR